MTKDRSADDLALRFVFYYFLLLDDRSSRLLAQNGHPSAHPQLHAPVLQLEAAAEPLQLTSDAAAAIPGEMAPPGSHPAMPLFPSALNDIFIHACTSTAFEPISL
jgi:hypothetical protein